MHLDPSRSLDGMIPFLLEAHDLGGEIEDGGFGGPLMAGSFTPGRGKCRPIHRRNCGKSGEAQNCLTCGPTSHLIARGSEAVGVLAYRTAQDSFQSLRKN